MIDLRRLRDDPTYREGATRKGADQAAIDGLLDADERRRSVLAEVESLRAQANTASKEIGQAQPDERSDKIAAATQLKSRLSTLEADLDVVDTDVAETVLTIPNPAHQSVPSGGDDDFELIVEVGGRPEAPPMDHADYGDHMGWVDTEGGAAVSGSRFAYLRGDAVLLEFALVQWSLHKLVGRGFTPIVPPVLVRRDMMVDAGFFPTDEHQVYAVPDDELFLVGTAEVPLAGIHRGDKFAADQLPERYVGFSTCFRREAGTYGKDTRGIFRVHQFDKVEMFVWSDPDDSWAELDRLLELEREMLDELGLPYRVVNVATGDLGAAAAKKYDCEVWLPSEGRYRELTSCSNYTDYSARRLGTRYQGEGGRGFVHTLNGTACAVGRTLVFLMENCQRDDGSFVVPEVLRPYCGLDVIAPPG